MPTIFHANSYEQYKAIKALLGYGLNAKFAGIFKMYGNFENFVTESRFYIYLIIAILLLLCLLKRVYFGGTSRKAFIEYTGVAKLGIDFDELQYDKASNTILIPKAKVLSVYEDKDYQINYGMIKIWKENKLQTVAWKNPESIRCGMIAHPACFVT